MPLDYKAARTREFTALLSRYPSTLEINGVPYPCLASPIEAKKQLQENNYEANASAEFCMWATDFLQSKITNRGFFKHNSLTFQLYSNTQDSAEPTVVLRANLKQ